MPSNSNGLYEHLWINHKKLSFKKHSDKITTKCQLILSKADSRETCSRNNKSTYLPSSCLGNGYVKHITEFQQFLFVTFVKFFFNFNLLLLLQDNMKTMKIWKSTKIHICALQYVVCTKINVSLHTSLFSRHTKPENRDILLLTWNACRIKGKSNRSKIKKYWLTISRKSQHQNPKAFN